MKKRIFILIIPAILMSLCPSAVSPAAQLGDLSRLKRVALVIGNGNYRHVAPLSNPENDARDMADALKKLGFATTLQLDQDRAAMFRSLRLFGEQLGGNTAGLFFFAGHGVQVNNVNYLLPTDADAEYPDEIEAVGIKADLVLGKMESAGNPLNLVILDSCRNNPFKKKRGWAKSRAALSRGLAGMSAPGGTMLIFATQPGETASDGDGQNSPFTRHLIRQMQVPGLEVGRMIRTVALQVEEDTGGNQTPWIEGILKGDFYFTQGKGPDEEMWEKVKVSDSADVLQFFIDSHPGSFYVPAARERIAGLKEKQKKVLADSGGTSTVIKSPKKIPEETTLEVTCDTPGAIVWINGQKYREAPITFNINAAGTYTVKVTAEGYEPYTKEEKIALGDTVTVKAWLEKKGQDKPFQAEEDQRFVANRDGTVYDRKMNLTWAATDNGEDVTWQQAYEYCTKTYKGGGWRMPTQDELYSLVGEENGVISGFDCCSSCDNYIITKLIRLTCTWVWASENDGSSAASVGFLHGRRPRTPLARSVDSRALPVRSGKW